MAGKRITLDELFAERAKELRDEANSPEGIARAERNRLKFQRDEAARLKWEAENPRTPFEIGAEAAANDEDREPPEGLDDADREQWLAGYDEERPDEDGEAAR